MVRIFAIFCRPSCRSLVGRLALSSFSLNGICVVAPHELRAVI